MAGRGCATRRVKAAARSLVLGQCSVSPSRVRRSASGDPGGHVEQPRAQYLCLGAGEFAEHADRSAGRGRPCGPKYQLDGRALITCTLVTVHISRRDYTGTADFEPLLRFTQRIWTPDSRWHLGDIAWNLGFKPEGDPGNPMAFWEHESEIVAWGWLSIPSTLALLVDPRFANQLVDEVVDWATGVAGGPVSVGVLDTETSLIAPLARQGRVPDLSGRFFVNMQRGLSDLPPVPVLPPGFTLHPVAVSELPARAALHRAIWNPRLTDDVFAAMATHWPYRREFDWVAVAPDGHLVSYILGWYDDANRIGEFEPVGTLTEYRRLGLSRALGIALMHAWREAGAERALVYARGDDDYPVPRHVYRALGFTMHGRVVRYRLPSQ